MTYQLLHAVALLSLSVIDRKNTMRIAPNNNSQSSSSAWSGAKVMALGTAMFSGSIYLLCLDIGPKKLIGPITPVGGLLLICGWTMVGLGNM